MSMLVLDIIGVPIVLLLSSSLRFTQKVCVTDCYFAILIRFSFHSLNTLEF